MPCRLSLTLLLAIAFVCPAIAQAETGYDAWLRYAPVGDSVAERYRDAVPDAIVAAGSEAPVLSGRAEIVRGVHGLLGRDLQVVDRPGADGAILIGTLDDVRRIVTLPAPSRPLGPDGYWLRAVTSNGRHFLVVAGQSDRGALYGAFALLRKIGLGELLTRVDETQSPYAPIRWVNQWDNLEGTIERGYGGRSLFWENGHARDDLSRLTDYARMLASVGINGIAINNVNANPQVLSAARLPDVARIAAAFRPWGIRVALAIDFGSPQSLGGLPTYDPLDPTVIAWWKTTVDAIYRAVPDFGGFVLKADSEGRVGPSTYGRTHADAANVVARALAPHGGVIFYRGFVYDHHMDWRNLKNDRARAAYDNFQPLDGRFDDNVIVQIKNGPIDFQVREPASPLVGALTKTNQAMELQVTQEYMGQARHLVFLVPMWKETLDFDMHVRPSGATPVKAIVAGHTFARPLGGFVGVANLGLDQNWAGNELSQANIYGFGRLAWNPDLSARQIATEWTRLTFGSDRSVVDTIVSMQLGSWRTYENYTGPLGLQTLTDIVGNHYGVAVEASERNGWGQWHRADEQGVGMDRTVATGTGFIGQYAAPVARMYESLATCPDDLLLFMHHVPYTYRLHSGKTVIQYIYDSHYEGAAAVEGNVRSWRTLEGKIDDQRYAEELAALEYQAGQAVVWRDAVTRWFRKESGIADAQGRVGNYPDRTEAERADLDGYVFTPVTPWEGASGDGAVECPMARCTAAVTYHGPDGRRDVIVQYFDINNGTSGTASYRVFVNDRQIDAWPAIDHVPTRRLDSSSSTRRVVRGVTLHQGDVVRVEGTPGNGEKAALDYIELPAAEPDLPVLDASHPAALLRVTPAGQHRAQK